MQVPRPVRGMRDMLPGEVDRRLTLLSTLRQTYRHHGFFEIETPIVESIEALSDAGGGENEKLMFKLLKRGEKLDLVGVTQEDDLVDAALRYDLTVPLGRFYAINQSKLPKPFYAMQVGPVFRAERPQRGRYRQFVQADLDILGEASELAEIQLLIAATSALHALGLEGFEIHINDRRVIEAVLKHFGVEVSTWSAVMIALDKLDKDNPASVRQDLIAARVDAAVAADLVAVLGSLREAGSVERAVDHGVPDEVIRRIHAIAHHVSKSVRDVAVVFDPLIVRGLGYYTSSVYEFTHPRWPGSIGGGGRYDGLLGRFGVSSPACGVSLGFERVASLLEDLGAESKSGERRLNIIFDPASQLTDALSAARRYRRDGYCVTLVSHATGSRSPMKRIALAAEELKAEGSRDSFWHLTIGGDLVPRVLMQ
ncbi:MAG: histidine--tRNA ligase [Ferrimicrobium sp.]